jgi:hypothetical protein
MPYPSVSQGDLTTSVISSIYNRAKDASSLAASARNEAFKRFKSVGLSDKQATDAVNSYNFGGAAFKSRFGGDRLRRTRGFFGSRRPQDDITVNERERVLRGMGLYTRKRRSGGGGGGGDESSDDYSGGSSRGPSGPSGGSSVDSVSPVSGLLPPARANIDDVLRGVRPDGEYMSKEERIANFKATKISRTSEGDLTERGLFGKKQTVEQAIVKLASEVKANRELLEDAVDNTSFIEKLFDLQKDAIEDAKADRERMEIAGMRDTASTSGYEKLQEQLFGKGSILGGISDFAGNALDLLSGGDYIGGKRKKGARRRLAGRKLGNLKNKITGTGGPTRSPIGSRKTGRFVNGRLFDINVPQFGKRNKNILQKGLQRGRIAGGKIGQQLLRRGGAKAGASIAGKAVGKSLLKKVPILGLGLGALFAAQRAMAGDLVGAGMELASGAASTIPGGGTAASFGIDAALAARDMQQANEGFEMGGVVDGPDTGYPVKLHGTEAIIPLDNKFTRGEKTVTTGGEYEKGNLTISRDDKPRSLKEKKETQKELADAFSLGLQMYEKKSEKGIFAKIGDGIKEWLDGLTGNDDDNPPPGSGAGTAPSDVAVGQSKLSTDLSDFRTQRQEKFGVSSDISKNKGSFNLAIRELRGEVGGSSISPLADDDAYEDIHVSDAHKHGYGFDVPVGDQRQAKFVVDFFRARGYSTIYGADDPSGKHNNHVHVEIPRDQKDNWRKVKEASEDVADKIEGEGMNIPEYDPKAKYEVGDYANFDGLIKKRVNHPRRGLSWQLVGAADQDQASLAPPAQNQSQNAQRVQAASAEAENARRSSLVAMAMTPKVSQPAQQTAPTRDSFTETGGKATNQAFDGLAGFIDMNKLTMSA